MPDTYRAGMSGLTALTIGSFDGVHCGHRALVLQARRLVGEGGRVAAMVFEPHPLTILKPAAAPVPLSTLDQRRRWLLTEGADDVIHLTSSATLLATPPEQFVADLVSRYRPRYLVEGPDFRFGRDRSGDIAMLQRLGAASGFETVVLDPVEVVLSDHTIHRASSSLTRWLVAQGRVADAARVLGRPYELETTVQPGAMRGRELGFPTANLAPNGCLLPADGVYAGSAELPDGLVVPAAISVGVNPTFGESERRCEAYLLDYDGPKGAYGWSIRLRFEAWLRDQIRFSSLPALIAQMRRDVERTRSLIAVETITA